MKELLQFQFRKFSRISYAFLDKNEILRYDSHPSILVQKIVQMTIPYGEQSLEVFFRYFEYWRFYAKFSLKMSQNKTKYTMDPGIYFLMKTNKEHTKSTRNSLTWTYSLIYLLINRCGNLKMLSKNSSHGALLLSH